MRTTTYKSSYRQKYYKNKKIRYLLKINIFAEQMIKAVLKNFTSEDLNTKLNFKVVMEEQNLQSYVLRTRSVEEKDFQREVSALGSRLEGIVVVDAEGKNALVRYGGPVEDLYRALGYSNKEIVITLESDYSLPRY